MGAKRWKGPFRTIGRREKEVEGKNKGGDSNLEVRRNAGGSGREDTGAAAVGHGMGEWYRGVGELATECIIKY